MAGQTDRDAKALAAQRERDRQLSIADVSALCEYVLEMADVGQLERRRAGGVPIVPGGRLWLAVKLYLDHRDVFDAARSGEFTSISAAGRAAGIAAAMPRRRLTLGADPAKWARALFSAVSRDELHAAAAVLNQLDEVREEQRSVAIRRERDRQLGRSRISRIIHKGRS